MKDLYSSICFYVSLRPLYNVRAVDSSVNFPSSIGRDSLSKALFFSAPPTISDKAKLRGPRVSTLL